MLPSDILCHQQKTFTDLKWGKPISYIEGILPKGPYLPCVSTSLLYHIILTHSSIINTRLYPETSCSLKRKCCHFDEILITDCTESCHFDNFRCSQWWKFRQNDDISVSVLLHVNPKDITLSHSQSLETSCYFTIGFIILCVQNNQLLTWTFMQSVKQSVLYIIQLNVALFCIFYRPLCLCNAWAHICLHAWTE